MSRGMAKITCVLCGASSGPVPTDEAIAWDHEHKRSCSPEASVHRVLELLEEDEPRSPVAFSHEERVGYWEAMKLVRRAIAGEE